MLCVIKNKLRLGVKNFLIMISDKQENIYFINELHKKFPNEYNIHRIEYIKILDDNKNNDYRINLIADCIKNHDDIKILEWLINNKYPILKNSKYSLFEIMILKNSDYMLTDKIYIRLIATLNLLYNNGYQFSTEDQSMCYAAKFGNIKVMKWLNKHNFPRNKLLDEKTICNAIEYGNVFNIVWLNKKGYYSKKYEFNVKKAILMYSGLI